MIVSTSLVKQEKRIGPWGLICMHTDQGSSLPPWPVLVPPLSPLVKLDPPPPRPPRPPVKKTTSAASLLADPVPAAQLTFVTLDYKRKFSSASGFPHSSLEMLMKGFDKGGWRNHLWTINLHLKTFTNVSSDDEDEMKLQTCSVMIVEGLTACRLSGVTSR